MAPGLGAGRLGGAEDSGMDSTPERGGCKGSTADKLQLEESFMRTMKTIDKSLENSTFDVGAYVEVFCRSSENTL